MNPLVNVFLYRICTCHLLGFNTFRWWLFIPAIQKIRFHLYLIHLIIPHTVSHSTTIRIHSTHMKIIIILSLPVPHNLRLLEGKLKTRIIITLLLTLTCPNQPKQSSFLIKKNPNMPSHFKVRLQTYVFKLIWMNHATCLQVKEYCPLVFRNLRERFGIDDAAYLKSLTRPPRPMDSPGRSGAKFWGSYDQLYVLKTLTSEEVEQMHSLLKHYHPFVVERHGKYLK